MASYILPQVQVFQDFQAVPVEAQLRNAFVFGPHYQVVRDAKVGEYNSNASTVFYYPYLSGGAVVDNDFVKLTMTNLRAEYLHLSRSASNPIVALNNIERNKLRAAPIIEAADNPNLADGVTIETSGYFTGKQLLPDNIYIYSTNTVEAVLNKAQDAKFSFISTSGVTGAFDILASDTPLVADVVLDGPEGIKLDFDPGTRKSATLTFTALPEEGNTVTINTKVFEFDGTSSNVNVVIGATVLETVQNLRTAILLEGINGIYEVDIDQAGVLTVIGGELFTIFSTTASNGEATALAAHSSVRSPKTFLFESADKNSFVGIALSSQKIPAVVDAMLADKQLTVYIDTNTGSENINFNNTTLTLTVELEGSVSTLDTLYTALTSNSDIAEWFEISRSAASLTGVEVNAVIDNTGFEIASGVGYVVLRDAYRIAVRNNDYIFSTGNGYTHSSHFKTRGVKVGDYIKWEFIDSAGTMQTGESRVTGFEADIVASSVSDVATSDNNQTSQSQTALSFKADGPALVQPGVDNQRKFNGVNTKVFTLDPVCSGYLGAYDSGVLEDDIEIKVTTGGVANVAKVSVRGLRGIGYIRTNAQVVGLPGAYSNAVYLGNNLWVNFDKGAGDADAVFQVGDTYRIPAGIKAAFTAVDTNLVYSGGAYSGSSDTTYIVEVVRGGVFNRAVHTSDGLINTSKVALTLTNQPAAADTVTIGETVFEFGAATPGFVQVTLGGTAALTAGNLAAAINASDVAVFAAASDAVVTLTGNSQVLTAVEVSSVNINSVKNIAKLTAEVDFTRWTGGDNFDEAILRCTRAGSLSTAEFALESQLGMFDTGIKFTGDGISKQLGGYGLSARFNLDGNPEFRVGDYWVIHILAARPRVKITDSLGVDQSTYVVVDDNVTVPLGVLGAEITFKPNQNTVNGIAAGGGLVESDVFYVAVKAESQGALRTLVLSDDIPVSAVFGATYENNTLVSSDSPSTFAITLYISQSSNEISRYRLESPPDYNWELADFDFTVNSGIKIQDASWVDNDGAMIYIPVTRGEINITYRALLSDYADGIYDIADVGTLEAQLGEITVDNPLALGVFNALLNSGARNVNFMAVPTNDLAGYLNVLDRASVNDTVYAFAPLTRDTTILDAVSGHIKSMSTETERKWRIGFFGMTLPTSVDVYTRATNAADEEWVATVGPDPARPAAGNVLLTIQNADAEAIQRVKAGDIVTLNFATDAWGVETSEDYVVARTPTTNSTIRLVSGPVLPINVAQRFELRHPNSADEIATDVAAQASRYDNRRIVSVFPSEGFSDGMLITGEYAAAQVAGLCCSVAPQQGLTNIEIQGFTDIPMVYRTFTAGQLDRMAGGGALILMQKSRGSTVYVRHQVTSAAAQDTLMGRELSLTKNWDSISYFFADIVAPYIGKYNVVPGLLSVIRTQLDQGISYLTSSTDIGLLGPQLIADGTQIISLQQHPVYGDHILSVINIQLPAPFNVMQLHLVV